MPKLLQICVEGNRGSTGTIAESIGLIAMNNNWESYIAHGRFSRPSKSNIIKIGNYLDVFLHGLETRFFDRHGLGSRSATKKLINKIKGIKPDVIHLHHLHGYYINIEILFDFLSQSKIPVVWTFHDCWSFTGHCAHFSKVGCFKWQTECQNCPQLSEYPASIFIDRSKQNFALKKNIFNSVHNMVIISVSKWLDGMVSSSFLSNINRQVIFNGIDTSIFNTLPSRNMIKSKYNIETNFVILGVATTWSKSKGLDDFRLLSNLLKKDEIIILIGLNKKQIKQLPPNIKGIPKTENVNQLVDYFNIADVFVNLSVEETFGLTTAEALSCGTPAVVYNATACPEVVDEFTGIVVEKNNINDVYKAINTIRIIGKEAYSSACRKRAVLNYCKNERYNQYIKLYKDLINI